MSNRLPNKLWSVLMGFQPTTATSPRHCFSNFTKVCTRAPSYPMMTSKRRCSSDLRSSAVLGFGRNLLRDGQLPTKLAELASHGRHAVQRRKPTQHKLRTEVPRRASDTMRRQSASGRMSEQSGCRTRPACTRFTSKTTHEVLTKDKRNEWPRPSLKEIEFQL